jgi:hypothetical protein
MPEALLTRWHSQGASCCRFRRNRSMYARWPRSIYDTHRGILWNHRDALRLSLSSLIEINHSSSVALQAGADLPDRTRARTARVRRSGCVPVSSRRSRQSHCSTGASSGKQVSQRCALEAARTRPIRAPGTKTRLDARRGPGAPQPPPPCESLLRTCILGPRSDSFYRARAREECPTLKKVARDPKTTGGHSALSPLACRSTLRLRRIGAVSRSASPGSLSKRPENRPMSLMSVHRPRPSVSMIDIGL